MSARNRTIIDAIGRRVYLASLAAANIAAARTALAAIPLRVLVGTLLAQTRPAAPTFEVASIR
jgi:hypothetical protein